MKNWSVNVQHVMRNTIRGSDAPAIFRSRDCSEGIVNSHAAFSIKNTDAQWRSIEQKSRVSWKAETNIYVACTVKGSRFAGIRRVFSLQKSVKFRICNKYDADVWYASTTRALLEQCHTSSYRTTLKAKNSMLVLAYSTVILIRDLVPSLQPEWLGLCSLVALCAAQGL